ncbi:MAG: homocysteine S-methyltransferase family protein [Pseudomonadota bacterium]
MSTNQGLAAKARTLPHITGRNFLTDGGIETTLIHHQGADLPYCAAFPLLDTIEGRDMLRGYFRRYLRIAEGTGTGFILESPTRRASPDWGAMLGYSPRRIEEVNRAAIELMEWLRDRHRGSGPVVISGCVGPRGESYTPEQKLTAAVARAYHAPQIGAFAEARADIITGLGMTHTGEAIGIALAAKQLRMPVVISFTVDTVGRLPSGLPLPKAIDRVDEETERYPLYYMINGAHPDHFREVLARGGGWLERIMGVRANATRHSHAELERMNELDSGNPHELSRDCAILRDLVPSLRIFGGCTGTDHRHLQAIAETCCN